MYNTFRGLVVHDVVSEQDSTPWQLSGFSKNSSFLSLKHLQNENVLRIYSLNQNAINFQRKVRKKTQQLFLFYLITITSLRLRNSVRPYDPKVPLSKENLNNNK